MAGRRHLPVAKVRDNELRIRVSGEELELLNRAAGGKLSTWARCELIELAKKKIASDAKRQRA